MASRSDLQRPGNRLACPDCLSADFIGENVSGWREIQGVRMVDGKIKVDVRSFERVEDAEHDSFFCSGPKCNVDRPIFDHDLVQIDHEGKPVPRQPPEQERMVA